MECPLKLRTKTGKPFEEYFGLLGMIVTFSAACLNYRDEKDAIVLYEKKKGDDFFRNRQIPVQEASTSPIHSSIDT